jgi:hypothetical protein
MLSSMVRVSGGGSGGERSECHDQASECERRREVIMCSILYMSLIMWIAHASTTVLRDWLSCRDQLYKGTPRPPHRPSSNVMQEQFRRILATEPPLTTEHPLSTVANLKSNYLTHGCSIRFRFFVFCPSGNIW